MSKKKSPGGISLALFIKGVEDDFKKDAPWPTPQRAAAEAILARYVLTQRADFEDAPAKDAK